MARQKGIFKFKGNIGDVTFFKTKDGVYQAREKGGIDGERIKSEPAFARTRENNEEFTANMKAGKLLRDALRLFTTGASDGKMSQRLTSIMSKIKNMDTISARGKRQPAIGIGTPAAKALLKGFNFNLSAALGSVLINPFALNAATGEITINDLVPINEVAAPPAATHFTLSGCWARVDFANGTYELKITNAVNLPLDGTNTNVVLTPSAVPTGTGTDVYLLKIEFFQEINGVQYVLNNGVFNALSLIEVL